MKQWYLVYNKEKRGRGIRWHDLHIVTATFTVHRRAGEGGATNLDPLTRRGRGGQGGESEAWEARG
jgi:hypothetical protein